MTKLIIEKNEGYNKLAMNVKIKQLITGVPNLQSFHSKFNDTV